MPSRIEYLYDKEGNVASVISDGKQIDVPADELLNLPGKAPGNHVSDLQTSIRSTVESIEDSFTGSSIIVDIEATHGGYVNGNYYKYDANAMRKSAGTWL